MESRILQAWSLSPRLPRVGGEANRCESLVVPKMFDKIESSNPPQSAKMQLTTTFVLLAIAAYVHADDTCIPCPATVDGQSLQTICSLGGETTCA